MFRLLRAALIGSIAAIIVLLFAYPGAFINEVYNFTHKDEMYPSQELKERIEAERALNEQPASIYVSPNYKTDEADIYELSNDQFDFTETILPFRPEQFSSQHERHLVASDPKSKTLWLSHKYADYSDIQWWQLETGKLRTFNLPRKPLLFNLYPPITLATPEGLLIAGGKDDPTRLVFIDPEGNLSTTKLHVERQNNNIIALNDGTFLVFGGFTIDLSLAPKRSWHHKKVRAGKSMAVERVRYINKQLQVERLTDVPGDPRKGMQMVELDNDEVMIVGGSTSKYLGSKPMTAETHILDLKTNSWRAGPLMNTPRTHPALQRLPDGRVLVAGGWTQELDWQDGPDISTEYWEPENNRFVPGHSLPIPLALHKVFWAPGQQGKQLLLLGGMSGSNDGNNQVVALDVNTGLWRNVSQNCKYHYGKHQEKFAALLYEDTPYLFCYKPDTPIDHAWTHNVLRLPGLATDKQFTLKETGNGINLGRSGIAFIAPDKNLPGLAAGGYTGGAQSASVDALLPDGRIMSLAPLNHSRAGAQAFRLSKDVWLVMGGTKGDSTRRSENFPPPELLDHSNGLEQARWQVLDFEIPKSAILTQLKDRSIASINPDGRVEKIILAKDVQGDWHVAKRIALASLLRARNQGAGRITVREVNDGRIIVAGGSVQQHRVAVLDENSLDGTEADHYQSYGYFVPAKHYDIYNPDTNSWQISSQVPGEAHQFAILPDGRVATWVMRKHLADPGSSNETSEQEEIALEMSTGDGKQWQPLGSTKPGIHLGHPDSNINNIYVINDELFIAGSDSNSDPRNWLATLEWFNPDNQGWEKLWKTEAKNRRWNYQGHFIKRKLTNGKQVILPVKAP